ncbi:hypothetical protein [Streptomyces sp. NPDC057877]|uniref:hypothetical protein n=1 Tax=Streptomyces sp. NPDC057877 TaxID=3346269 RepID=UPI0036AD81E6
MLPLLDQDGHRPGGHPADPVDSRERALLMRAFTTGNSQLATARTSLGELGTEVLRTFQAAQTAIDAVQRFTAARSVGTARNEVGEVRVRHAKDGPEGLRHGRSPWSWLRWVMVVLNALYDLPFIGDAMTRLLDVAPGGVWSTLAYAFAFLAAVGVSFLQFALAHLLARSLFRMRTRAARRTERVRRGPRAAWRHWRRLDGPRTETRHPDGLPWAAPVLPVLANVLLVVLLAATAHGRAKESNQVSATFGEYGYVMAVFLIIALSLATLTITVLAHNPYAESDKAAQDALSGAGKKGAALVPEARRRLAAHSTSWHRLSAAAEQAAADARRVVDEACALIIDERSESGRAGALRLPLREYAWPVDDDTGSATPRLRLETLDHYGDVLLGRYSPDLLEFWLDAVVEELNTQFALPDTEPPEWRPDA